MESETDTLKTWYDAQIDILNQWYHTLAANDSGWHDALAEEDSLKVDNALAAEGSLIVGLAPSEDSVKVKNRLTDTQKCELLKKSLQADAQERDKFTLKRISEKSKGRTALHVAARRGNVKLVERILKMAENGTHGAPGGDQGTYSSSTGLYLLLSAKDSDYGLDALAMAVVNGNAEIVNLLLKAASLCQPNPYGISPKANAARQSGDTGSAPAQQSPATTLKPITERIFSKSHVKFQRKILQLYSEDRDFNFLDIWEYLFHFTFSTWSAENEDFIRPLRKDLVGSLVNESVKPCQTSVWYQLFTLKDGQGRTPLHVAVDSKKVDKFLECIPATETIDKSDDYENLCDYPDYVYLNAPDSVGRTPLYRAAAKGNSDAVTGLLGDERTDVYAEVKFSAYLWGAGLDDLSRRNDFQCNDLYLGEKSLGKGQTDKNPTDKNPTDKNPLKEISSTVLHVAIIHKRGDIVNKLLYDKTPKLTSCASTAGVSGSYQSDLRCTRPITWPVVAGVKSLDNEKHSVSAMQLSVLMDSLPIFQALLKKDLHVHKKEGKSSPPPHWKNIIFLAAALGSHYTIKGLLDHGQSPLLLTDKYGNSALHNAVGGYYVKFQPHLVDFVGCEHVRLWREKKKEWDSRRLAGPEATSQAGNNADKEAGRYGQRRGCIKLLLQAGMNVWQRNDEQVAALPKPDAPDDFVAWWYDEVVAATKQAQEKVNAAASGISITATLVATASYVGPYTPPLGLIDSSVQLNILAVRIFVVCNSLSFYAALAAIIYALLPSLPLPEESVFEELKRTRLLVAVSLAFLLAAIVCVLVTFAASYIAVTPDHGLSHHSLVLGTIIVGGFFCFLAITRFLERWINVLLTLSDDDTYQFKFYEMFVNKDEIKSIFEKIGSWITRKTTSESHKNRPAGNVEVS